MKKVLTLCLLTALLPFALLAQSSKKKTGSSIHAATTFNYYSALKPYKFVSEYAAQYNDLILNFITKNAGTFTLEEGESKSLQRTVSSHMPSQLISIGASLQRKNLKNVFHEISLTKFSFAKSNHSIAYLYTDDFGDPVTSEIGYKEDMFAFAFRYELGKFFGRNKLAKIRFGLSGGIEPSYYHYRFRSGSLKDYPLEADLLTIDLALIPTLSASLSKKLSLDFKVIPNFLTADFGTMKELNPSLPKKFQDKGGLRNYKSPDMTWAFSVLLRYTVKEAKKKRGED